MQDELMERTKRNPSFSAKAFAKQLGVEPSSFYQILSGKRALTDKMCRRLADKLSISPAETLSLLKGERREGHNNKFSKYTQLRSDQFHVIADWYHYAILELTHLSHFKGDVQWISKVLGVPALEIKFAVERLQRLGLLEITQDAQWIDRLGDAANSGVQATAPAMRKLQKDILLKAIDALENTPFDERVQLSLTLPTSKTAAKAAKDQIIAFLEELDATLRKNNPPEEIYNVSFSLYPVSDSTTSRSNTCIKN